MKNDKYKLSVVIVNWNTSDHLKECLKSLFRAPDSSSYQVVVVDNGSTDDSVAMLSKDFPQVTVIENDRNLGFARANNIGIRACESQYICLLNSDVNILDSCMALLYEHLEQHPHTGIVGPQLLNADGSAQPSCYGAPNAWNSFCHAFGLPKLFPKLKLFGGLYNKYRHCASETRVDVMSACFWVMRKSLLNEIGLLDETFFIYWEDFDFCKRVNKADWHIVYLPQARAIHYGGSSSAAAPERFAIETEKTALYYWRKHHGPLGHFYAGLLILFRHTLRLISRSATYLFIPKRRAVSATRIRQSAASIKWLLTA